MMAIYQRLVVLPPNSVEEIPKVEDDGTASSRWQHHLGIQGIEVGVEVEIHRRDASFWRDIDGDGLHALHGAK
jgi:hypothetical protein